MAAIEKLVLQEDELPKVLEVVGHSGQRAFYNVMPASRKFGASLQKVEGPFLDMLMQQG